MSWAPWDDQQSEEYLAHLNRPIRALTPEEIHEGRLENKIEVIEMMLVLGLDTENNDLVERYTDDPTELFHNHTAYMAEMGRQVRWSLVSDTLDSVKEEAKYRASRRSLE